jgi:hypothetical protein
MHMNLSLHLIIEHTILYNVKTGLSHEWVNTKSRLMESGNEVLSRIEQDPREK